MNQAQATEMKPTHRFPLGWLALLTGFVALATIGVTALLVNIFERQQEARTPFVRLVEVNEISTDPKPWGTNWPMQYEGYLRTVDTEKTEFGGSNAMTESKLEQQPWLKRLYAGYAFSIDYREARGHAYMLYDQEVTERVTKKKQGGACLHCHASVTTTYRRIGLEAQGKVATPEVLASDFNWPAVMEGFRAVSKKPYEEVHAELFKTPDNVDALSHGSTDDMHIGSAHPVSCIDCHDPETMRIRVTRPGFMEGIAALAKSDDPVPHLPSIHRWRESKSTTPYDPNVDATRQEMRSFVCGQCHVEYYCSTKATLVFPWGKGLKADDLEAFWDEMKFDDGTEFLDYLHGETGAPIYKAQHPEFELWSQGIHARAGVSCADCHMPYERQGAMKVSSHWVRSPMLNVNRACQTCHHVSEDELKARVDTIQDRTKNLIERAAVAMTDMLDAMKQAKAAGADEEALRPIFALQKKAMWRLDYISSENSKGFHADQEAARILGESIDFSRQAQAAAITLRANVAPDTAVESKPVEGVTPTDRRALEK